MNNIAIYPVFQDRQTLSHLDLNNSFDYLQNQDGLTRVNLVGTGIVHGLEAKASFNEETGKITISKGCGITSEGRLIFIEQDRTYSYYKEFQPVCKESSSSLNGTVHELKEERVADGTVINQAIVNGKVAVLFYDLNPQDILCSCDKNSNGQEQHIDIKLLLIPKEKFNNIPSTRLDYIELLPRVDIQESFDQIFFSALLQKKINSVKEKIKDSYSFIEKISKEASDPSVILNKIGGEKNKQNIYNFFNDLISAYNEFVYCGNKVVNMHLSSLNNFPCHLILGDPNEQEVNNDNYRHHFRPATASDDYAELNRLWERIVTMIEYFNPDVASAPATDNSIRLTPSVYGAVSLSEKAIPYYYKKKDGIEMPHKVWSKREKPLGYWYKKQQGSGGDIYYGYYNEDNWKNYDLERYNFVRIEGYINISYVYEENNVKKTRKQQIEDVVRRCNLPITVIALKKTPSAGENCISESKKEIFAVLQNSAKNSVSEIKVSIEIEVLLTSAFNEATTALGVAEQAELLAKNTVAEKIVKDAAGRVRTVLDAAKLANTRKTVATAIAAKNVAEVATTAMKEAAKGAESTTAAQAVNSALTAVITAARKIATAAQAIQAKESAESIEKGELNLELCLNSVDIMTSTYNDVFSFACQNAKLNDQCQKIISFLQWIDTSRMTYQRCEAKKVFSSFASFKEKHPGLQHKSGVPIGGTFILVYDDKDANKKIVADFCLPYRVTQPD